MEGSQSMLVPSTSQALQTIGYVESTVMSMEAARAMQSHMVGSNMQRKRQDLMQYMDEAGVGPLPLAPPPGAGIGRGATPESAQSLSPLQPIPVSPVSPDAAHRAMAELRSVYQINAHDDGHLQWLVHTGLIR